MLPTGFDLTISAGEQPQAYALDRATTGTGKILQILLQNEARTGVIPERYTFLC